MKRTSYDNLMQRSSQSTQYVNRKKKKSPSAFQSGKLMKFQPYEIDRITSTNTALELIDLLLNQTNFAIEILQEKRFSTNITHKHHHLLKLLGTAIDLTISYQQGDMLAPEQQPTRSHFDPICGFNKLIEIKKQSDAKQNHIKQSREIVSTNWKEIKKGSRSRKESSSLVALKGLESEQDLKTTQIHSFYRDKLSRDTHSKVRNDQSQTVSLMSSTVKVATQETSKIRSTNAKEQEQFNFDYNADKINIKGLIYAQKNAINVLKTIYKVNKDKPESKIIKKTMEKRSFVRNYLAPPSFSPHQFTNIIEGDAIRRKIENQLKTVNVRLSSIKIITDH